MPSGDSDRCAGPWTPLFEDWMDMLIDSRCTPQQMLFWCPDYILRQAQVERPQHQFNG